MPEISEIYEERRQHRSAAVYAMNAVESAISGHIPETYERLFTDADIRIQLQTTRSAYDTLRKYLGEVPILPHVDVLGKRESASKRNEAELVEKVCYGYHNGARMRGGPGFDTIAGLLADHQVAFYDSVLVVHADMQRKTIYFEVKDPRTFYPPRGWTPWSMTPLDGALFVHETTLADLKARYPEAEMRLSNAFKNRYGYGNTKQSDDNLICKVGVWRSKDYWCVKALGDRDVSLVESDSSDANHPGVVGVASFMQHGAPLLTGQIGIEAALMKVMNQQIQNTERINKAPIVGPPLLGDTLRWGEYNVIDLAMLQGRQITPQRMAPDSPSNLTQVMGSLIALAEKFNYNPESSQGAGPAVSGKAIQQLQAGPRSLVTGILFGPYKTAFPTAYDDAMRMELNLWPNHKKSIRSRGTKGNFEVEYTPSSALQDYIGHVRIEDARPGGYNAFLEAVQKRDARMASLRDVLEADPETRDVEETIRRIDAEDTEKFLQAAFEGLGSQDPMLAIRSAGELLKRINSGKTKAEAIQKMQEEGFFDPPAPDPMAAAGGLPPELAGLMGGAEEMAPPSLAEARGF